MSRTVIAVLVDPHARTVTSVPVSGLHDYYRHLGTQMLDHQCLRSPGSDGPGVMLWVDDEGVRQPGQKFWSFTPRPDIIYGGKGLLVAFNADGDDVDGLSHEAIVGSQVVWRDVEFLGTEMTEGEEEHPIFGKVNAIRVSTKFGPKEDK